jgi:hypothetical protein
VERQSTVVDPQLRTTGDYHPRLRLRMEGMLRLLRMVRTVRMRRMERIMLILALRPSAMMTSRMTIILAIMTYTLLR